MEKRQHSVNDWTMAKRKPHASPDCLSNHFPSSHRRHDPVLASLSKCCKPVFCILFLALWWRYYSSSWSPLQDSYTLSFPLSYISPLWHTPAGGARDHTSSSMASTARMYIESTWNRGWLKKIHAVSPFTFTPLPLGSIAPLGWMNDQLQLMADGLAGHEKDFYHFVNDSSWLGGKSEYSNLNEGFPYWFNGAVPLAYGLNDTRLIGQVHDSIDYVLEHQQPDGWLGPETTNATRDLWARFPLFLGFTQVMEAEQSQSQRLLPAMYKFINLMRSMLEDNQGFIDFWGKVRYQDMLISLQWLHENAPSNNSQLLLNTMDLLRQRGRDWADYYQRGTYIFKDLDLVQPPIGGDSYTYPWVHGVNAAQCKFVVWLALRNLS